MRSTSMLAVILTAAITTNAQQATNEAQFSSAADQLISAYLPPSVVSALQSAASITDAAALQSTLLATPSPANIPSEYQANIQSLESAISALRGAANTGIPGAPRVVTSTDSAGSTAVTTIPGSSVVPLVPILATITSGGSTFVSTVSSTAAPAVTTITSGGSTITSTLSTAAAPAVTTITSGGLTITSTISTPPAGGAVVTTITSGGSTITSTISSAAAVSTSTNTASTATTTTAVTSTVSTLSSSASPSKGSSSSTAAAAPTASEAASSSSKGWAAPTQIPFVAAGAMGVLQLLVAL